MRKILFTVFLVTLNISVFADIFDDYDNIYTTIQKYIEETIEWKYINWNRTRIAYFNNNGNIDAVYISIYFNAGVYELNTYFNNIIKNSLMVELMNNFQGLEINISTYYPFSIILINDYDYEFDERLNIINDIHQNTNGIIIENIFQNSLYGYLYDYFFGSNIDSLNSYNNFDIFLEVINRYFGIGNIISF